MEQDNSCGKQAAYIVGYERDEDTAERVHGGDHLWGAIESLIDQMDSSTGPVMIWRLSPETGFQCEYPPEEHETDVPPLIRLCDMDSAHGTQKVLHFERTFLGEASILECGHTCFIPVLPGHLLAHESGDCSCF